MFELIYKKKNCGLYLHFEFEVKNQFTNIWFLINFCFNKTCLENQILVPFGIIPLNDASQGFYSFCCCKVRGIGYKNLKICYGIKARLGMRIFNAIGRVHPKVRNSILDPKRTRIETVNWKTINRSQFLPRTG